MPAKRELSMRQLRHLLRLHHGGVSAREIGRRLGVARSTIQDNLKRAAAAGLKWPLGDVTQRAVPRSVSPPSDEDIDCGPGPETTPQDWHGLFALVARIVRMALSPSLNASTAENPGGSNSEA